MKQFEKSVLVRQQGKSKVVSLPAFWVKAIGLQLHEHLRFTIKKRGIYFEKAA